MSFQLAWLVVMAVRSVATDAGPAGIGTPRSVIVAIVGVGGVVEGGDGTAAGEAIAEASPRVAAALSPVTRMRLAAAGWPRRPVGVRALDLLPVPAAVGDEDGSVIVLVSLVLVGVVAVVVIPVGVVAVVVLVVLVVLVVVVLVVAGAGDHAGR